MAMRSPAFARWHWHVGAINAPLALRHWLTDRGSLTTKLIQHSRQFRVQRLHQRLGRCLADEAGAIGQKRRCKVWEREVLLRCDGQAVVFAHTVMPLSANASDWPLFGRLGERSLGSTLFGDPRVVRGRLQFARLKPGHPLMKRVRAAVGNEAGAAELYARRSLFYRRRSLLMVTEIFLPATENLQLRMQEPAAPDASAPDAPAPDLSTSDMAASGERRS